MVDFLMIGFSVLYAVSSYLRRSVVGGAVLGLYAGLFFNLQYNVSFVKWLGNHGVSGDGSFLAAIVALFFVLCPVLLTLFNFKSGRGNLILRLVCSIVLGVLTGYYVGQVLGSTRSLSSLAGGPLYSFVQSFITPLGVIGMGLGLADITLSRSKKSAKTDDSVVKKA
jgi:hypothetical protein